MKRILIFFAIIILKISLFANWVEIPENSHNKLFECFSSNLETTELEFSLNGYESETIIEKGQSYQKISYWNEGEFVEIGKPDLPRFSRLVAIPNEGDVSIDIVYIDDEILSDINVYPRQQLQLDNQSKSTRFIKDEAFYRSGDVFPDKTIEVGEPAILRDFRVVNVTINPFQYNPKTKELRIIKNAEIRVSCNGKGSENIKIRTRKKSRFFEQFYKSSIINYDSVVSRDDGYQHPCYLFIYPNNSTVETNLQDLIDWKHQKGFEVVAASTAETGTSLYSIKNYIQDAYDNWDNPPEFICIVGDAGGGFSIPTGHLGGGEGDQYYVLLEGNDILADAFIGRLSFNTIYQLQTIISKILHYEKEPYLDETDWYNRALLVGDPTSSGQSCVDTKQHIKEMIDEHAGNIICEEVYSGNWVSQMANGINNGVSYFNYRGFIGMSGWDNSDIDALYNGFMLPVAVFLTCSVGDFEGTNDCRSERFLKAGSPGVPKGAIAAIGTATYDTNTCFNNCVDAGIFYGIFVDKIFNMGGALNRGKLNLYNSYPDNPYNAVYKFSYWNNLMGDPGMEIWTGIPEEMLVTYDSQVSIGVNYLEVTVENSYGYTLENAWVTALMGNDEIFSTGLTDSIGKILLPIDIENTGNVNLTVTKHNFIPHLGSFDIVQEDIFVNVFEIEIDDDDVGTSSGNGDGIINPGEDIELNVSLKNYGTQTANSVSAGISSESEFITITDETEHYGDIASGSSAYPSDDFDFSVSPDALGGVEIQLNIFIEDGSGNEWNDIIYLVVEGPNLYANNYSVIDGNNGILDQGETAELIVTIENVGTVSTNGINGILSCSDDRIIIEDSVGYFGTISSGGQGTNDSNPFVVTANEQIISGTQIPFNLHLYNTEGYDDTANFILEVGEVFVTDPLGPDEYGYYCYDDGDTDYNLAPEYSWIEIDPNYGGSGTVIPLYDNGDMGDIEDIDLPFVLRFYDYNYTTLTVCSNGWLTPGETEIRSFMNWHIPGPLGPSPIIAPFWDDLKIGNGNVCYYYDEVLHYFIIEWSHLQNDYDNSEETFQVILFDSNYYPTTTGNSEIFFQYKTINNVNQGNYGPYSNHGQYATVGIEDHTGTVGLEYTYNNQYPTAAKTLESEMALLFTGPPIPEEGPFLIYDSYEIDDSQGNNNGIVNPGETIAMSINLRNVGIETAFDVYATLSTIDPFVNITDSVKFFGNIDSSGTGTSIGYYIFGVATICPDQHDIIFDLSITSEGGYEWSSSFVVEVLSPDIATSSDILDFEEIYIGYPESMSLTVFNEGSDVLNITNIYSDNPDFTSDTTSFSLQDGESQDVMVTVNTSFVGMISGTLFIISNDPDEPEIYVSLLGLGVDLLPPDISVYPECISEDLFIGETSTQTLTIYNDGGSDLSFEIENTVNSIGGMATSFDGEDDYIEILDNPLLNLTTDLSFGGWIKTYSIYMNWQPIIVKGMMWTGHQDYYRSAYGLGIYNSQYWYDIYTSAGFGNIDRSVITVDIPDTDWHFIFGTFNNGLMKFYLDGSLTDTLNAVYSEINTNSGFLGIGREIPLHTNHFYGEMDEIRIYNVVLDEQEIQSTMNTSLNGNEPGLIGYWNFNGDNPWSDISGNGNDGIAHGNMTIVESTAPIIGWLSATPTSCTLPPDSSIDIEITFDATVLEVGNYEADIVIYSNDPDTPEIIVPVSLNVIEIGISDNVIPLTTKLRGNYPNPFNHSTTIKFDLKETNEVKIAIYNIKGQLVSNFVNQKYKAGSHSIVWNGKDENCKSVSNGIYFYKIKAGKYKKIKRMLLMR